MQHPAWASSILRFWALGAEQVGSRQHPTLESRVLSFWALLALRDMRVGHLLALRIMLAVHRVSHKDGGPLELSLGKGSHGHDRCFGSPPGY